MTDEPVLPIAIALALGIALGTLHFGSLWWVVRQLSSRRRPALWLAGTSAARFAVTLPVLLLVSWQGWPSLVACLTGLLVARAVVVRWSRPTS